jgi:hypothetical protein
LLIGLVALELASFAFPEIVMPGVGHVAHLGGMAMGWFFVRKILQGDWSRLSGALRLAEKSKSTTRPSPLQSSGENSLPMDFIASEVDPILDKISAHGIQSLTTREREILEKARKRIQR